MISKDEVLSHFLKDDKPFAVNLYEKYKLAYEKDIPVFGNDFYPPNVWSYFQSNMSSKEFLVQTFGLFDDAERRMISFNNKYNEEAEISCIKISNKSKFRKVNHRDYLGSILSLGIKRNKIGDLIVDNDKCYVAVSIEIRDYIINNLEMVANCPCKVEIVDDISSLPKVEFLEEVILVPKLRLDAIVSKISKISRAKASEIIDKGLVLLDYSKVCDKSKEVKKNQRITIRGTGKFILGDIVGNSKSGKYKVIIKKYT
ncbi:MAG: YlmH/Sll1252 family protein [Clostridiales bacterium]|nr:YlmH/Sll1252 family protein [Clostridiales bacterium]MDY2728597.1 YlmH/Sll1252 family protein [Clostridium sp.]